MSLPPHRPFSSRPLLWLGLLGLLAAGQAGARPLAIGGLVQSSVLDTRVLDGTEMIPLWGLPRLGVSVRNDPADVRLQYGARELRYSGRGWEALGFALAGPLPAPKTVNGSLLVPLRALNLLGVPVLADTPTLLDFAAPARVPTETLPPSGAGQTAAPLPATPAPSPAVSPAVPPAPPLVPTPPVPAPVRVANLDTVRVSRTLYRTVEVQRVVLELSAPAPHTVVREARGLSIELPGVGAQPSDQTLPSGDRLSLQSGAAGTRVQLQTAGGRSEVFTLENPYRVVIDTTTHTDPRVPPPVNPATLPPGVTYTQQGRLHLLRFDPSRYRPRVVSAPSGRAQDVAALVQAAGGVAGVNGGYFDPASNLPVDFVAQGGLMTAPSLERRATVGFPAQGQPLFGYPRPRYVLTGPFGQVTVNSVRARPDPALLTAFVGDGHTRVGAAGLTTLHLAPGAATVTRAHSGEGVPAPGTLALTFDPARFPQLPRAAGEPLVAALNWQAPGDPWTGVEDALSAGPLLVQGGRVSVNPEREGFNTAANIWRATRQVAFGTLAGEPTIAYFEHGTPEAFAAALAGAGVRDAVRLDSGSSATAYVTGGFAGLGGYLNTVWSRPVPNAIVLVPRGEQARR